jgi:hypothetical protein
MLMTITEQVASLASLDLKATVWLEYHNERQVAYDAVELLCNDNGLYSDGAISRVMEIIYENQP